MTDLALILRKAGALKHGDFTLSSGKKSDYYVDVKQAVTGPVMMKFIVAQMSPYIWDHDQVAGIEMGSIPLAVAAAFKFHISYILIQKSRDPIGRVMSKPYNKVLPIEDVTTTGITLAKAVLTLRGMGADVQSALSIVDREEGAVELLADADVALTTLTTSMVLIDAD